MRRFMGMYWRIKPLKFSLLPSFQLELALNGPAHQNSLLVGHVRLHSKTAFAINQCHDSLFVILANDGNSPQMVHMLAIINVAWSFADQPAIEDLATPIKTAHVAFVPWLLATQVLV